MRNNDLSNELTKRILVTVDTLREETVETKKVLGLFNIPTKSYTYNRSTLSRYYLFADRTVYTLELISFDMDEEELAELVEDLDKLGTSPFRYYTSYESVNQLVGDLPYRPEVVGVIDTPDRLLRYGHWGMDFSRV